LLEKRREEKIKACEKQAQERYRRLKNKVYHDFLWDGERTEGIER
jgi:hypothetical protein